MGRGLVRNVLAIAAWALVAALLLQVFLAGLGVFRAPEDFELHRNFGYFLELIALVIAIVAALLRLERRIVVLAFAIFGLFLLQSVFVNLRTSQPLVAALHPVNGFVILLAAILLARKMWRLGGITEL